jgi:peroxiredoxin
MKRFALDPSTRSFDEAVTKLVPPGPSLIRRSAHGLMACWLSAASIATSLPIAIAQSTTPPTVSNPPALSKNQLGSPAPALSSNWPEVMAPDSDAVGDWIGFSEQLKKLVPNSPQQTVELKLALQQSSHRIMELLPDPKSASYLQAQSDYFAASALLLATQSGDMRLANYEKYRDYLASKSTVEKVDLETILTTCLYLEPFEDKSLALRAYTELADWLRSKDPIAYAEFADLLKQNALRLQAGKTFQIQSRTMDGKPFDLEKWRGKHVLLFFWSSTSKPAVEEFPFLRDLHSQYHSRGFEVVGIALDESIQSARSALSQFKPPWPTLWDDRKQGVIKLMQNYGINSIPTLILLDPELRMLSFEANSQSLRTSLERHLPAEPSNPPPNK